MDQNTPNLKLPYIAPGQAQKHVTHNEAIRQLDALVQLSVKDIVTSDPSSPHNGERYLINNDASGNFAGKDHHLAAFQDGAWTFYKPEAGWRAFVEDQQKLYVYMGSEWQSLEPNLNPVDKIGVNATADEINRLAVKSPASLFDHVGNGHQVKVNKATETDTASLLLQTHYQGQAEIGLTGDNDLHVKVSDNGQTFKEALIIDHASGAVSFPHGTHPELLTSIVTSSGGPDEVYGIPNLLAVCNARSNFTLIQNRMYFNPVYVDRPTVITGAFAAQYTASTTAGSVLRAGLYKLGEAEGDHWNIGDNILDFGTAPSDEAGHKFFDLQTPLLIDPGWYATAIGTNGASGQFRYMRILSPGSQHFYARGSGTTSDIGATGACLYLYKNNSQTEITGGLSSSWPTNPVLDIQASVIYQYMPLILKWQRWS